MSEKILEIKDERLSFFTPAGEVKALNGVSFSMNQGDVLGIVGESGSGKSVTAYSIMGLTAYPGRLVGGTVWFNGHQIDKMTEKEFRKIRGNEVSIIFQDPMTSLNPVYTIGNQIVEVILLHTKKTKQEAWARARELLELVGINEPERRLKQYPHELSGGMRQRVMIAIALACEPKLLIADEPTTALDVTIQAQILELMNDLRHKLGMSIIMITHDLGVVAQMCEKIAVMYAGHIVEYGTTAEIFYKMCIRDSQIIFSKLPVSARTAGLAVLVALCVGIPLGCLSAYNRGKWADNLIIVFATCGIAIPSFISSVVLLYTFGMNLKLLPTVGLNEPAAYIMPVTALAIYPTAYITRLMRSSLLDVMGQDYMRTARAKGVSSVKILFKHALRNAILPVVTYVGPMLAGLMTGSFVVEKIFSIPGLGRDFVSAITNRDYMMIMGTTILLAALVIVANVVVDILYKIIDPRIKLK